MRLTKVATSICLILFLIAGSTTAKTQIQDQSKAAEAQQDSKTIKQDFEGPGLLSAQNRQSSSPPSAPEWVAQLPQEHQDFVVQLLDYWQQSSDKVQQYQCEFSRYDYDTKFCNWRDQKTNRLAAASIMTGEIRFASPDKASYETLLVYDFNGPPEKEGEDAKYKKRDDKTNREKWICDGKAIFEMDFKNKKLYETAIPPEMQGKGLINSPIPFLFGASKEDILNRYWVRIITPEGVQDEYWLEATPKKIEDSRSYTKIDLVISRKEFLPVMLHLYAPNYDPKHNNLTSRVFEFKNRKVNGGLSKFQDFLGRFVRPSTPMGWERLQRNSLQANQQFDRSQLDRPAKLPDSTQIK